MLKNSVLLGSISGFLAVAIGAFGAHALAPHLSEQSKTVFETGSKYHFYHSLTLIITGFIPGLPKWVASVFLSGIILFSGSLYALAITNIKTFGYITPIGGVLFLSGWLGIIWQTLQSKS